MAVFPAGLATDADLGVASVRAFSTLAFAVDATQTTVTVGAGHGALFAVNNFLLIGMEQMRVAGIAGDVLTVVRGQNGTAGATHAADTDVVNATVPKYHNAVADEIKAVEANVAIGAAAAADGEVVLFSGAGGKQLKRGTGTGPAKLTGGVLSTGNINLASEVTGTLPVSSGGTSIIAGTSGGIPYFSTAGSMASSGVLTANAPVVGGGAGATPSAGTRSGNTTEFVTVAGAKTAGKQLAFDASGNVTASASDIAANAAIGAASSVDGEVALFSGAGGKQLKRGTGTGPAKLASGVLSSGSISLASEVTGTLPVANGGTGITAGTSGGVPWFSAAGVIASSGALAAGAPVIGGGAGVAPSTGTRSGNTAEFATITGTKTAAKQLAFDASGNVIASASDITANTALGAAASVDSEVALFSGTGGKQLKRGTGTGPAKLTGGVLAAGNINLASEVTGTLPVSGGGTGITAGTSGGVPYFSAAGAVASSGVLAAGAPVTGGGAGAAPSTGTRSGNTAEFATVSGAKTTGKQLAFDASGNVLATGTNIGAGTGGTGVFIDCKAEYGATGDGTTNDSTAIQNAINAATSGGRKTVFLAAGNYNLGTTGLVITGSYVSLVGDGSWAATQAAGTRLIYTGTGAAVTIGQYVPSRNTASFRNRLENIYIDITGTTDGAGVIGLELRQTFATRIQDVDIIGPSGAGVNRRGMVLNGGNSGSNFGSVCQIHNINIGGSLKYGIHFPVAGAGYTATQIFGGSVVGNNPTVAGNIGIWLENSDTNHFFGLNVEGWNLGMKLGNGSGNSAAWNWILARFEGNGVALTGPDWQTDVNSDFNYITGSWATYTDNSEYTTVMSQTGFHADNTILSRTTIPRPVLESNYGIDIVGGRGGQVGSGLNFWPHRGSAIAAQIKLIYGGPVPQWTLQIPQLAGTGARYVKVDATGILHATATLEDPAELSTPVLLRRLLRIFLVLLERLLGHKDKSGQAGQSSLPPPPGPPAPPEHSA